MSLKPEVSAARLEVKTTVRWSGAGEMEKPHGTFMSKDHPAASSSADAEKSCATARGIMPCCAGVPSIVCVCTQHSTRRLVKGRLRL